MKDLIEFLIPILSIALGVYLALIGATVSMPWIDAVLQAMQP